VSVVCESISVIVRCDVVEARYPNGIVGLESDVPPGTYCSDGFIARIGFTSPWDADTFIERLIRHGFLFMWDGEYSEIAMVDQHAGLVRPCSWLRTAQVPGIRIACLVGQPVGQVMAPPGWQRSHWEPTPLIGAAN